MGYLGRRIGKSQNTARGGDGADGNLGGGILDLFDQGYFAREGNINRSTGIEPSGLTATGGVISDYTSGSDVFRAHIFTSSGTFTVSELSTSFPNAIEYLVVAGGGGGGSRQGGGGGAGGLRSNFPGMPAPLKNPTNITATAGPTSYPIVVGGGGVGGSGDAQKGVAGSNSVLTYPGPNTITTHGGGGGGSGGGSGPPYPNQDGNTGGSGGGASAWGDDAGSGANGNTPPFSPAQGTAGGDAGTNGGDNNRIGGGGGGFTAAGTDGAPLLPTNVGAPGGAGISLNITGITTAYAGGGGGGVYAVHESSPTRGIGGSSVGGEGNNENDSLNTYMHAVVSTGSGGGGGGGGPVGGVAGGQGSSGIVVIRYKIGSVDTGSAKASGGVISFYNGKTIHTFTGSGTFTAPGSFNETVEYVVVAGGGGGGADQSGGGGAGGYRIGTTPISGPSSTAVKIGAGGNGGPAGSPSPLHIGGQGAPSYFGTPITSAGGGYGSGYDNPTGGNDGGSGGGGSAGPGHPVAGYTPGAGNTPPTSPPQGNPSGTSANNSGAGGGGAGAAGGPAIANPSPDQRAGSGGIGVRVPTTFRDPSQTIGFPGPGSTTGWFAGGGGGGANPAQIPGAPGRGKGGTWNGSSDESGGPYAGAGPGVPSSGPTLPHNAEAGSGSGGGGGQSPNVYGSAGGSGIVLIAYPT